MRKLAAALALLAGLAPSLRAEEPEVQHQPVPCTVPDQVIRLCAEISDDNEVSKARIYFRVAGGKYYSFSDMTFQGLNYCGNIPAPREGKVKAIEYYIQGIDNDFESRRTSTYVMNVQAGCDFPPLEKDPAKAKAISVFATNEKQGKKLDDGFDPSGVTFVAKAR